MAAVSEDDPRQPQPHCHTLVAPDTPPLGRAARFRAQEAADVAGVPGQFRPRDRLAAADTWREAGACGCEQTDGAQLGGLQQQATRDPEPNPLTRPESPAQRRSPAHDGWRPSVARFGGLQVGRDGALPSRGQERRQQARRGRRTQPPSRGRLRAVSRGSKDETPCTPEA